MDNSGSMQLSMFGRPPAGAAGSSWLNNNSFSTDSSDDPWLEVFLKKKLIIFEEDLKKSRFLWIKTQESEGFQGGA